MTAEPDGSAVTFFAALSHLYNYIEKATVLAFAEKAQVPSLEITY